MRSSAAPATKQFPRLAVIQEDGPLLETAANCAALLPPSPGSSRGAYVAVVSNADPTSAPPVDSSSPMVKKAGPLSMADLLSLGSSKDHDSSSLTATKREEGVPDAAFHICLYTLSVDSPTDTLGDGIHRGEGTAAGPSRAPDMMLIQTVSVTATELAAVLQPQQPLAAAQGGKATEKPQAHAAAVCAVEQILWVGVTHLAVKTRQRQVLLIRSGLTDSLDSSTSDSSDSVLHSSRVVCQAFNHVEDMCVANLAAPSVKTAASTAVLLVAGLRRVEAVVCASATPRRHAWSIGPFRHLTVAVCPDTTSADQPSMYLCGTTSSHSVEVFRVTLDNASLAEGAGVSPAPVCVHQVLLTPGHFFYGAAVTARQDRSAASAEPRIDFWIVGAATPDAAGSRGSRTAESPEQGGALPLLRGPDGRFLHVSSPSTNQVNSGSSREYEAAAGAQHPLHRTLNSVWRGADATLSMSGGAPHHTAALSEVAAHLESVVSVRIGTPSFLPATPASTPALTRYILHVEGLSENGSATRGGHNGDDDGRRQRHVVQWRSEVLSLDTEDCVEALAWLASREGEEKGTNVQASSSPAAAWKLGPVAVVASSARANSEAAAASHAPLGMTGHELIFHTSHRMLKLVVGAEAGASKGQLSGASAVCARGTHALSYPQRIVGLCPVVPTEGAAPPHPLLLFSGAGTVQSVLNTEEKEKVSVYGQPRVAATALTIAAVQGTLLYAWKAWVCAAASSVQGGASAATVMDEKLLAAVRSIVAAEGERLQRHFDTRMDRVEALLRQLTERPLSPQ